MNGDSLDAARQYTGLPAGAEPPWLTQEGIRPAGRGGLGQLTLEYFKQATLEIVAAQDALAETLAIPDAGARLERSSR